MDLKISRSKNSRASTPSSRSQLSRSSSSGKARRSSRIVEDDFRPITRQLAIAAKSHFRLLAIYDTPFPPAGVARTEYGWTQIRRFVKKCDNQTWKILLRTMEKEADESLQLVQFVSCSYD